MTERKQGVCDAVAQTVARVHAVCVFSCCTWCGEPVLPGWFVVIQSLQHDIHGKCKQASQEDVENYIEEKNETCRQREERVVSNLSNISEKFDITNCYRFVYSVLKHLFRLHIDHFNLLSYSG